MRDMKQLLALFDAQDQTFCHFIDLSDDSTAIQDEDGKVFITFSSSLQIIIEGKIVGRLHKHLYNEFSFELENETYVLKIEIRLPVEEWFEVERAIFLKMCEENLFEKHGFENPLIPK